MDKVFIHGLQVATVIGVYDWEQEAEQPLLLDIECATDTRAAAAADDIGLAVDYGSMAERVRQYVAASRVALLETLAEQLASMLLAEYAIARVQIRINKPQAVPGVSAVGICIEREAEH